MTMFIKRHFNQIVKDTRTVEEKIAALNRLGVKVSVVTSPTTTENDQVILGNIDLKKETAY